MDVFVVVGTLLSTLTCQCNPIFASDEPKLEQKNEVLIRVPLRSYKFFYYYHISMYLSKIIQTNPSPAKVYSCITKLTFTSSSKVLSRVRFDTVLDVVSTLDRHVLTMVLDELLSRIDQALHQKTVSIDVAYCCYNFRC